MNNTKLLGISAALIALFAVAVALEADGARRVARRQLEAQIQHEDVAVTLWKRRATAAEHERDSLTKRTKLQDQVVAAAKVQADTAEARVVSRRATFTVDTTTKLLVGSDSLVDSTKYGTIKRASDGKRFAIPQFVLLTLNDLEDARTKLRTENIALIQAVAFRDEVIHGDTKMLEAKDSVITHADSATKLRDERRPSRLGFRSGVVAGATVALAVANPQIVIKAARWVVTLIH